jgi:transcriptional regulator with XRE-family HTH domain
LRHFAEIERGEANPTLEVVARLAKIVTTTPASLAS